MAALRRRRAARARSAISGAAAPPVQGELLERASGPWLVPLHVACYLAHFAQEVLTAPRVPLPGSPSCAS